ncbi:hypothetical protein CPB86DRAFT_476873 [Serendipita vermifera]|nr:hypothetical protein CPB86DRAFT_476873 [Serendipita vermifera]
MATYKGDTPHKGTESIVIAFDIGTTHSAVSFSYLYPGELPDVRAVIRWPGQLEASSDSKIPTIIAYKNGKTHAFGAEARDCIDDDEYEIASWFKLHLHPDSMKISNPTDPDTKPEIKLEIPELPTGTSLSQIYSDFIKYLYHKMRDFFMENTPNGRNIWTRIQSRATFIFCTPNGWDISQHVFMRNAAVAANLVPMNGAEERISFITEGEASVHYAIAHTRSNIWLRKGSIFAVVDVGGSTVDSTLYECRETRPLTLKEVYASECVQVGGVFVDRAAKEMLKNKLGSSTFAQEEYLKDMLVTFERKTKRLFDGTQTSNIVDFGRNRDNDRSHGIIKGKLTLKKEEVKGTFDDTITQTITSCRKLFRGRNVPNLLLVGGFGESPYLRTRLREAFQIEGTDIVTVDEPSKKAAAEGAIISHIKQLVIARATRFTFGTNISNAYQHTNPIHRTRASLTYRSPDGVIRVRDVFYMWALKDTPLPQDWSVDIPLVTYWETFPNVLGKYTVPVFVCDQPLVPQWTHDTSGILMPNVRLLCNIEADMARMASALENRIARNGRFWQLDFKVVITFQGATLQGKLVWMDEVHYQFSYGCHCH